VRLPASPASRIGIEFPATLALKSFGFLQQVKRRPDCRMVADPVENRDSLAETFAKAIMVR
jgi:hypothetical protein